MTEVRALCLDSFEGLIEQYRVVQINIVHTGTPGVETYETDFFGDAQDYFLAIVYDVLSKISFLGYSAHTYFLQSFSYRTKNKRLHSQ